MPKCNPVTHVIFDLDGTLLDTETLYSEIFSNVAKTLGKSGVPQEVRAKTLGLTEENAIKLMIDELSLPTTVENFSNMKNIDEVKFLPGCKFMPGAEKLICHFQENKIPMAVATSSSMRSVKLKFTNHLNIYKCFSHVVSGSDDPLVKKSKPSPDIFLVAASRFCDKPNPKSCLVFEDARSGVQAAKDAEMQVVMIPMPELATPEYTKNATMVLKSLCDFKPECFNLPPYTSK